MGRHRSGLAPRRWALVLSLVTASAAYGLMQLTSAPGASAATGALPSSPVAVVSTPSGGGYWIASRTGEVVSYGDAPALPGVRVSNVVGMAATPSGGGVWLAGADGGVFSLGDAGFYKSLPGLGVHVNNIVGIASTPSGRGYWLTGADGGVFAFGDAGFYKSLPGLNVRVNNIVGIAPTPSGRGYWLAGADGGVFAFGDAGFYKSLPGLNVRVNNIVGITATPSGRGYWLTGSDGGVFAFGDAGFYQSLGGVRLNAPVAGMTRTRSGAGYLMVARDGGVFAFGDARFRGRPTVADVPVPADAGSRQPARTRTLSNAGVDFIATWEGFRPTAYNDGYGTCTIGYGFVLHKGRCTAADASQRMDQDLAKSMLRDKAEHTYAAALRSAQPDVPLTQTEFDALVDLVFNTGPAPVQTGTIGADLRARAYGSIPEHFRLYVKAGGTKSCGLYSRRVSDGNLFAHASYARLAPACPFKG
ncbi:lysozyme [Actinoplanes bogorensis]|uniref:Lysozyme n=1 Tax=Paractinoplanes bogorensis TaxID=1610840 RepID=A0ABS5YR90_9ACTN|nr:lysozyme [Actinoplanes bogorensis]MBU2665851.1 lysozyme [Actinoplanes bogorensis]